MKTSLYYFRARIAFHAIALTAVLVSADRAHAQASLTLSGGNNTPFVLTLNTDVTYVINAPLTSNAPFFLFKNVGDAVGGLRSVTGSISFTINGGLPHLIGSENSGVAAGNITTNDLFFFGLFSSLAIGDVVTVTAGTITTNTSVVGVAPASGSFTTFLVDGNGAQVSTAGVPTPEPASFALLGLGGSVLLSRRRPHRAGLSQV